MIRVLVVVMSCAAALLLSELILRVFDLAPTAGVGSVNEADFERVPGLLTPHQDLVDQQKPELPFHVHVNSLGYRGRDFPRDEPVEELRVLAVGDSFTYGDFVDDDETLPAQLESRLRERCDRVTVINAGVGGTTIVTAHEMVRRARSLSPDVVLLTFSENDVTDLVAPMWHSLAENRRRKSQFPLVYVYPVLRSTAIWNFALKARADWAARQRHSALQGARDEEAAPAVSLGATERLRAEYADRLRGLRDLVDETGARFVFGIFPSHLSLTDVTRQDQLNWVESTADSLRIDRVSFAAPLRESGLAIDVLYLLPEDGHPSESGYRVAADALLRRVDWQSLGRGHCDLERSPESR